MTRDTVIYSDFGEELGSKKAQMSAPSNDISYSIDTMDLSKKWIIVKTQKDLSEFKITPWSNNNIPWFIAFDDGRTFSADFELKTPEWIVGWKFDAYTNNRDLDPEAKQLTWTRIDTAELYALKKVIETQIKVGKITGFIGWGIQWIGDLGWSKIQNAWHKNGPRKLVSSPYTGERFTHDETPWPESGWTPDLRARIEWTTEPLIATDTYNVALKWSLEAKLPVVKKYWETSVTLAGSLEAKIMDRFTAEVWVRSIVYRNLPLSDTIRAAQNNPRNAIVVGVSADVWKTADTATTVFVEFERAIRNDVHKSDKNRGSLWVKVSF